MASINAVHRLLSNLGENSLFSIKAKRQESGRVVLKTGQKKVSVLVIPADVYTPNGGDTFAKASLAEDAILHPHKHLFVKALATFCCAAHHAQHVDCLCEMLTCEDGDKVLAYRFYFIDRLGAAAAAAGEDDDDDDMEVSEDEDDDGSEDGAIAAAGVGAQKKQFSFCEAMMATVSRKPLSKQMAMDLRYLNEENALLDALSFQQFSASYCQNTDVLTLPITSLKWKKNGMALHQIFSWQAAENEVKRHCSLPPECLEEDKYVRRPPPTAGSEQSRQSEITQLMFERPGSVLTLDTTTLLSPSVFGTLRRPDIDQQYSRRMRNHALDEDADLLQQIRQSASFGVADQNDTDVVRRRPAYAIMYNTLKRDYDDALACAPEERWEKLLEVWKQAAMHWNVIVINSSSLSCPGLSLSMRSWLGFIRSEFNERAYRPPVIPFSVDAGIISNFVHWLFANLETYFLMLKQHSNFFKLYCMMLGCTLPRDNGRVLPFVCMLGPAMSSKSYLLDCIRQIFLEDTTTMVTSSTNKARTTGYELSFETVELYDEGTAGFLQTASAASDPGIQQRQELLKQILTSNDVSHQMASSKEMPNRSKRKILVKEIWEQFNQAMIMATNHVEQVDHAIKTRIHEEFFAPSRRANKDIASLQSSKRQGMNNAEWKAGYDAFILTMQQFQTFHNMVTAVMKSGVLPAFEFKCFDMYMKYIEHKLKSWGIAVPSPRTKERMQCLVQSLTILRCWLACYVYEGAIFYQKPPSFAHIDEWARHVCSDSNEAVLQTVAMMSHSLIGESVARGQALYVLYRYITSEACVGRKYYTNTMEDAKQMFMPNSETVTPPAQLPDWLGVERGCSWRQLKRAHAEIEAAQLLRDKSPATAKSQLSAAKGRITEGKLDALCSTRGLGNVENQDAAQPVLDKLSEELEAETTRCCECRECAVKAISANYVLLKQSAKQLATGVYTFWQSNSDLGEPMSEAELIRTFDTLGSDTATVSSAFVLRTDDSKHGGASGTCYMSNLEERKQKQVVFAAIGKDRVCICLGAMLKSCKEAAQGGVCVEALLAACQHKHMEESTMLLSVPSSIVEPQFPKLYKTVKSDKTFWEFQESIGRVQARALGIQNVRPRVKLEVRCQRAAVEVIANTGALQYECDLEFYSKYLAMKTLGLDVSKVDSIHEEGRLSKMLEQRFRECYGDAQSAEEFTRSIKEIGSVVTRKISTELA